MPYFDVDRRLCTIIMYFLCQKQSNIDALKEVRREQQYLWGEGGGSHLGMLWRCVCDDFIISYLASKLLQKKRERERDEAQDHFSVGDETALVAIV